LILRADKFPTHPLCFCARHFLVDDEHWRHDGVVRVYDWHNIQANQLGQGAQEILSGLFVVQIWLCDQNLSNFDAILSKHGVVERHQARLTDGRRRSGL
jgi:hypothetical protein